mmetsp:Transcript_18565/g.40374  ORF Transcript_18565/g.40374 Transcript_18565/m.40374 type:complete len:500 (+) Transcript_18565:347-1846(+)
MTYFIEGIFVLNLCVLLVVMGMVTHAQNNGAFYVSEITVTFGEQIWPEAIVTKPSGEVEKRTLLFSYFNGVYRLNGTQDDGSPIYVEQNKFDGSPFETIRGAEIRYCRKEKVWAFTHVNIKKKDEDEIRRDGRPDCPWLLRSPETSEFNLLDVTGDWSIWTGSIQQNGHFSAVDNRCIDVVDCNYNGECENGKCICSDNGSRGRYFGIRCEHTTPCPLINGRKGGMWDQFNQDNTGIYQRPVYRYQQGIFPALLHQNGVNPVEDDVFLMYTGSRWMGAVYPRQKLLNRTRTYWRAYMQEFHAFWEDTYSNNTKFTSDPTTQSNIIGLDFYLVGRQGEEFGPFGELFPLSDPKGSGLMRCIANNTPPPQPQYDIHYLGVTSNSSIDSIDTVVYYEIGKDRDYESFVLAKDCANPITNIYQNLTSVRSPKNDTHDSLSLMYSWDKSQLTDSNIWNTTNDKLELCHFVRLVFPAVDSLPKMVIIENKQILIVGADAGGLIFG